MYYQDGQKAIVMLWYQHADFIQIVVSPHTRNTNSFFLDVEVHAEGFSVSVRAYKMQRVLLL